MCKIEKEGKKSTTTMFFFLNPFSSIREESKCGCKKKFIINRKFIINIYL